METMAATDSCSVVLLEFGIVAFDQSNNRIASTEFDNATRSFRLLKSGGIPEEIKHFIEKLRSCGFIVVNDASLVPALRHVGLESQLMSEVRQQEIQNNKTTFLVQSGFAGSEADAMQKLRNFAIELSSTKVKEASEKLDLHVIQSVNALDEVDKIINTMSSRMREWYGLHFPELDNLTQSLSTYAEIAKRAGQRENITKETLESIGFQEKKIEVILDAARRSKGGDITPENLAIVRRIANEVITMSDLRKILADHVDSTMDAVAANTKELLTAVIGARIIAKAGSLSRLATLPASTIQVLGAEKALFRALKTGSRPPKHGLIFQHPLIHSAPKWQRGKIARAVASKVAIAARIDYYRHSGKDQSISDRLTTRIEEIREKYKEPIPEKVREKRGEKGYMHFGQREQGARRIESQYKGKKRDRRKKFGKRRY